MADCLPVFPEDLVCMTFDGTYTADVEPNMRRTTFESGDIAQRPRQHRTREVHSPVYRGDREAVKAFRQFVKNELNGGASSFLWTDPISGEQVRARIPGGVYSIEAPSANFTVFLIRFGLETWV